MKKNYLDKLTKLVSTVILLTVLTLMLTGCNTPAKNDVNSEPDQIDETSIENISEVFVSIEGGSGKATVKSPVHVKVLDVKIIATIEWSSPNYDYMIVDGNKYLPVNTSGNSVFEIPIDDYNCRIDVIADTVAMSKPHEIEYALSFSVADVLDESKDNTEKLEPGVSLEQNADVKKWIESHELTSKMERKYAEKFAVSYYDDKYCILTINGTDFYLVSQDSNGIPADLPESITIINAPIDNVYVVSSASYDYFSTLDALSSINYTSLKKGETDDELLNKKLDDGTIKYAGKYSAPDYELLLSGGCNLVVENTMILHSVDVLEQLKKLKIKTIIDYSSKESSPLGRMEWIKLYGILTGKEKIANDIFEKKEKELLDVHDKTNKKVAYFYISNTGAVVVRKNQDYIAKLIEMSGGEYVFSGNSEYDGTGTMSIQKEAFFEAVSDCDYLIYNTTISGPLYSLDELASKCEVLKNTKAYKEGNVYATTENIYVKAMGLPDIARDINNIVNGNSELIYLYKLN